MNGSETASMSSTSDRPAGIRASDAYLPDLESLRGWAILLVFACHADQAVMGGERAGSIVDPLQSFVTAGHTGVTLFFVLSAFLLALAFLVEGGGGRRVRRIDFFRRRALRIMPLYGTIVIISVALCLREPRAMIEGLQSLFFVNSVTGVAASLLPYSSVWWSLATEAQFYVVLPALGLCLRSRVGRALGLATLLCWAIAYVVVVNDHGLMSLGARLQLSLSILGRAPAFLSGIAAAAIMARHGPRIRAAVRSSAFLRNGGSDLLLVLALCLLGLLLQEVSFRGFFAAEIAWTAWHVAESALWASIILLVVLMPLRTKPLIANRLLGTIGLLSYSLYLVHHPILHFVLETGPALEFDLEGNLLLRITAIAGAFLLSCALAALTYRVIERPFLVRKAQIDR